MPRRIHTLTEWLKEFVCKHFHFSVCLSYLGSSAELPTRWLMLPHVEHLIELAEGTVRWHRLALVCTHLDGAQAIIWQAWENDCWGFFSGGFCVFVCRCPQIRSRRHNPLDYTLQLFLCWAIGHILLSPWWVLLVMLALCVLMAMMVLPNEYVAFSQPLIQMICSVWLWPPSPYSYSFLFPCNPHTSHLKKTPVVAAGRTVSTPSSPLSWTWRGTDCKARCVQKTETLSRGRQELSCLTIPFVVLMRRGSAVLYCEGPAGCKLIFIKVMYIRRCAAALLIVRVVH